MPFDFVAHLTALDLSLGELFGAMAPQRMIWITPGLAPAQLCDELRIIAWTTTACNAFGSVTSTASWAASEADCQREFAVHSAANLNLGGGSPATMGVRTVG